MRGPAKVFGRQNRSSWQRSSREVRKRFRVDEFFLSGSKGALWWLELAVRGTRTIPPSGGLERGCPDKPERADQRSQSYIGIGAAMAIQYLPRVAEFLAKHRHGENRPSARSLIDSARTADQITAAKAAFFTWRSGVPMVLCHERNDGGLDLLGGTMDGDELVSETLVRELDEEAKLHSSWNRLVTQAVKEAPMGHAAHSQMRRNGQRQHHAHVWAIELSADLANLRPSLKPEGLREVREGTMKWRPLSVLVHDYSQRGWGCEAQSISEAVKAAGPSPVVASLDHFQPWMTPRAERKPWRPAVKLIRATAGGRWRAWTSAEHDPMTGLSEPVHSTLQGRHRWTSLPDHLQVALSNHFTRSAQRAPLSDAPIPETNEGDVDRARRPLAFDPPMAEPTDESIQYKEEQTKSRAKRKIMWDRLREFITPNTCATTVHDYAKNEILWRRLRELWDARPPSLHVPNPGLGSARGGLPSRRWATSYLTVDHRVADIRKSWELSFVKASRTPPDQIHLMEESDEIAEPADPPADYHRNCLYVRDLCIRRKGTKRSISTYRVDVAVTVAKALADTGAGPSVVTTELLALLPNDACVHRDTDSQCRTTQGPNGKPLTTHGFATLVFQIGERTYRHRFTVIEGKPLLLLGNDFLDAHRAVINLNEDSRGGGSIALTDIVKGSTSVHHVKVTCDPAVALFDVASVESATGATPGEMPTASIEAIRGAPVHVEPLPKLESPTVTADELAKEHLGVGQTDHLVFSEQAVVIPARSRATVWLRAPLELKGKKAQYLVEHLLHRPGVDLDVPAVECRLVTPSDDHRIPVVIWNSARKAYHVPAYTPVARLNVEHEVLVAGSSAASSATYDQLTQAQRQMIDLVQVDPEGTANLTPEQRLRIRDLLAKHVGAFALDPQDPGHTHVMEVELPLKPDAVPHRHPPSRVGEAGREIIEKHVADMESRGIIRKSNSAWSSRVVLVKKKGGEVRFCIDYRDTNSKLQYLDSPIPLTVEALDRLSSGKGDRSTLFLSTLDLASGFWCLPIREKDKEVTAFSTGRAKYEFNYLPFGVQSGPSYMCRLMDAVLSGLAWEICMPYLDDVGVWSTGTGDTPEQRMDDSFEQMMHRLDLVFSRLGQAGLTCKAKKCILFATETAYLGHMVGRDGLKMDPEKIDKVSKIDPLSISSLERVRAFLGLCSYYRRFVPGFSKIAQPLTDLTQKGVDVETESQKPACQEAIVKLKAAITSEPVLAAPRFDRQFKVKTDGAQTEGLGGVLSQDDDDKHERVIAYYGRRLNKHERNYTVTEIELLAALESIRNWRPYLWGRRFKLIIDHAALKWLHTMKETFEGGPASRLMRWILKLSEYNFEVEHKSGVTHCDADGLSRLVAMVESSLTKARNEADCMVAAMDDSDDHPAQPSAHRSRRARRTRKDAHRCLATGARPRLPVRRTAVTARKLQLKDRCERNTGMSAHEVFKSYFNADTLGTPLRAAQAKDEECVKLRDYIELSVLPPITNQETLMHGRWLARESRHLSVVDGMLVHVHPQTQRMAVYVPRDIRHSLLYAFHDQLGHQGRPRMLGLLGPRYYWPGMKADIDQYVSECHECTLAKPPSRRQRTSRPPTIGSYPFDLLYCDIVDMAKTHDYDEKLGTGFSKLVVFADSLSHWVEAVPFHKDPTSEDVMDAFLTHVVARYGAPRGISTDLGSNLTSMLCRAVYDQTGVDLSVSPSDHHESAGLVERFNQTLTRMTRAADEGGEFWVDHLPFLLMSYRATPTRITRMSPAELLYGRQLRLPAQMNDPVLPDPELPSNVRDYATKLNDRLRLAWNAARDAIHQSQAEAESDTAEHSHVQHFNVDDRVCRLLPRAGNKLQYIYAGPYRIAEVLSAGRYTLRDLENRMLSDTFDVSQLRPYLTNVDTEQLQADEYIVEEFIDHRMHNGERQFQVKWRGYSRAQATWEPRSELMRRCSDLVEEYERTLPEPKPPRARARPSQPELPPLVRPAVRNPNEYESDDLPSLARFARGRWEYGRYVATPRGRSLRWFQPAAFSDGDLGSVHFQRLRSDALEGPAETIALVAWESASYRLS